MIVHVSCDVASLLSSTDEALEVDVVSMVISAQVEGRGQLSAALQQDPALLYFSFDAVSVSVCAQFLYLKKK